MGFRQNYFQQNNETLSAFKNADVFVSRRGGAHGCQMSPLREGSGSREIDVVMKTEEVTSEGATNVRVTNVGETSERRGVSRLETLSYAPLRSRALSHLRS